MDQTRTRRKRGSLSPEEIIAAAFTLLDLEGESALTFARLGQELQASPTAVYRHFDSRDALVASIADHLDGMSLTDYSPTDDWRVDLEDLAWRAWRTALAHPAAAGAAMGLITNGINELRAVDAVLRAIHMTGLRGRAAVVQYQVYSNLVLAAAGAHGARLSSTVGRTPMGWIQVYTPVDPADFPYAESVKTDLRLVDYEEVFSMQLVMYLDALEIIAAGARE